jgi:hypothetical protein
VCTAACRHGLTPQQLFGGAELRGDGEGRESGSYFASVIVETPRPCLDVPITPDSQADHHERGRDLIPVRFTRSPGLQLRRFCPQ